jgi:tetratricopeptide (TPR) repeat protein
MAAIVIIILGVLMSAVLLARDTKRRTGQIAYLRVLLAVAITFFGAASRAGQGYFGLDPIDFLAGYAGMLTFLWFIILRPKTKAQEFFKKGVSLLNEGEIESALSAFNEGLTTTNKNKEKGYLLYNSAICNVRLGKHDIAIATLHQALSTFPSLKSKARKDKDFSQLHNNEQFQLLLTKE